MIKLKDHMTLKFSVGDFDDFISTPNFYGMEIKENAGGLRPVLNIRFGVLDDTILPYLNKGNIITLSYGIDEPTSDVLQFEIDSRVDAKRYGGGANINIIAVMYNQALTSKQRTQQYINKYSYEVFNQISTQCSMRLRTNVVKTADKQTWQQNGQTNWEFLNEAYLQAYSGSGTFYCYGFDNNNIYFYDVKQLLSAGVKWCLTTTAKGTGGKDTPVVNIGTYNTSNTNMGPMSRLVGRNRTTHTYNVDTGEFLTPKYSLHSFCTMDTTNLNINSNGCEEHEYNITCGDTHEHDITAINQNSRNNLLFSSYALYCPVISQYRDFRLFDVVSFVPPDDDKQAAGIYIITGICRQIKDNRLQLNLVLNRESPNGLQGSDLEKG